MWMTGRQAARVLGLGRETTARVLASGLVGEPVVTSAASLWDAGLVDALRERPEATVDLVRQVCPDGLLVARVDPRRTAPEGPWRASVFTAACLGILARDRGTGSAGSGGFPLVATVGPYVVSCHDVVDVEWSRTPEHGRHASWATLLLASPGDWHRDLASTVLRTPPGHPLLAWQCPMLPNHPRRTVTG